MVYGERFPNMHIADGSVLRAYETLDGVPSSLVDNARHASTEEEATELVRLHRADRVGYAAQRAGAAEEDAQARTETDEADGDSTCMAGLDEVELQFDTQPSFDVAQRMAATVGEAPDAATVLQSGGFLASTTAAGAPFKDYDPRWPLLVHPVSFRHGTGAYPKGMSLERWVRIMLLRHPRAQYAQNVVFLLDMFNVVQRHAVNTQTTVQLNLTPSLLEDIGGLTAAQLGEAMQVVKAGLRGKALSDRLRSLPSGARALYDCFKFSSARVLGSPQSFMSLRSRVYGMWHAFGPFTSFLTINPSELNARLNFELAGHPYGVTGEFGAPDDGRPSQLERWRIVARNPVAAAEYFRLIIDAFCAVYMGWPIGSTRQLNPDCLYGVIKALYFKWESSGRGAAHGHGQPTQRDLEPRRLWWLLTESEHKDEWVAFLEQQMCQWYPDGWAGPAAHEGCPAWARPIVRPGAQPTERFSDGAYAAAHEPPLHDITPARAGCFVARGAQESQNHDHTATCAKGGRKGDDMDCRGALPRVTRGETEVHAGGVLLRRDHGMLAPYLPSMMLAHPCNMAVYLSCEVGRWAREHKIWMARKAAGETVGEPPALLSPEENAANNAEYSCKYTTKADGVDANTPMFEAAQALPCAGAVPTREELGQQGRRHLRQFINHVHGSITYPSVLVATMLLGYGDSIMSHDTVIFQAWPFTARLTRRAHNVAPADDAGADDVGARALVMDSTGAARCVTFVDDYDFRPDALSHLAPVALLKHFEKKRKDPLFRRLFETNDDEDLAEREMGASNGSGSDGDVDDDSDDGLPRGGGGGRSRRALRRYAFKAGHPQASRTCWSSVRRQLLCG